VVWGILEDENGYFWISTNKGLSRFQPETGEFRNYDSKDGLQSNEFNRNAYYKDKKGKMYFGGVNGLNAFFPHDMIDNPIPPKVVISGLYIYNKAVHINEEINGDIILDKPIYTEDKIILSHRNKVITLEFAALHYSSPEKNKYQYQLEGFDPTWINTDAKNRQVTYTNLPTGTYIFKVKASNSDGIWNEKGTRLELKILPPFYQTWWFRFVIALIFISIIVAFYYYRLSRINKRNKILEALVKERTSEIERKNEALSRQADNLQEINLLLSEKQEEIKAQAGDLENSNQELIKLNATKDRLFSIIGHDLKNPFQSILNSTSVLFEDKETLNEIQKVSVEILKNSSTEAFNLLTNLLEWAKAQTGNLQFNPEVFSINKCIQHVLDLLKLTALNKGIIITYQHEGDEYIYADRNMISTVLRNLINNAIKYSHLSGKIEIVVSIYENKHHVKIKDKGIGIDKEIMGHIHSNQQTSSQPGTMGETGTGLGLKICSDFIRIHNGTIDAEENGDMGSCFTIKIPYYKEKITKYLLDSKNGNHEDINEIGLLQPKNADITAPIINEGKTILLVEDNTNIRTNLKYYLSRYFIIEEAVDGIEGIEKSKSLMPDLIISDVMMPRMDGFELCNQIKTNQETSHIPVILLTAQNSEEFQKRGLGIGADDYLNKPFNPDLLLLRIKNLIKSRDELKRRFGKEITLQPKDISITSLDETFLNKAISIIETNISDVNYSVEQFSEDIGMSHVQLYRKLKALTNESPSDFIRTIRLKRAAQLLSKSGMTVAQVNFEVGFKDPSYFSKCFKKQFGVSPSEYNK